MALPIKLIPGQALQEFTTSDRLDSRVLGLLRVEEDTGVSYTVQASDHGSVLLFTSSAPVTVVAPDTSSVAVGTYVDLVQMDGDVVVEAGGTATVDALDGVLGLPGLFGTGRLLKIGPTRWLLMTLPSGY
jgi:hypothetical protein